jgi:hypothetical protein
MTEQPNPVTSFDATNSQPLIGIPFEENGRLVVRYFADEAVADAALSKRRPRDVRRLAGVWKDLDWEEAADALDRIRHESKPTPPIDLGL